MKRAFTTAVLLLVCAVLTASCGSLSNTEDTAEDSSAVSKGTESDQDSIAVESSQEQAESAAEETKKNAAHFSIDDTAAKAVTDVALIPDEEIDISRKVNFEDEYGRNVLHTGVVGLVGAPVNISFEPDEVGSGRLVFVYDPENLKGVRPDALMFMWYDEENYNYQELEGEILDEEKHAVMISIEDPGVYMLVNKHEWFAAWGIDTGDNGLEDGYVPGYSSDIWATYEYIGEIEDYADIDYIHSCVSGNSAHFAVSTPEELASAVYYVNCAPADNGMNTVDVYIELLEDIDLEGIKWAPMGWSTAGIDNRFKGTLNGNGHVIKNMDIGEEYKAGFIGESFYSNVYDISFENASVKGGVGCAVVLGDDIGSTLKNVSAQGTVEGGTAGALAGRGYYTQFSDCSADVTVNGEPCGEYLSYTQKEIDETVKNLTDKVEIWVDDDNVVHRGESDSYTSLTWYIKRDGVRILERGADDETELEQLDMLLVPGHYSVYIEAYVDGNYVPVSDTVEYDIEYEAQ